MKSKQWTWLIAQPGGSRRQLWIKGRRMTASQLVGHMDANGWTLEETARQFDLPIDAVAEARRYTAADRELIAAEAVVEERSATRIANVHPPDRPNAPTRR